ncbi:macrosialin-like [Acipenser ruthenus]|uniref:macrosialin-like n=1 Tax=Acipenser ruthenus TaxID=7906 RepID=UPI0027405F23|nr:macrosialin-like [Acipenser ruthenus]XP_058871312.1 macrosialin-like [Acipenser ruthenus]
MKTTGTMLLFLALAAIVALCASEEENPSWPHHKKAATMSPAKEFTSPTQSTTIPVTNHTTHAPTTNHTIPMTNLTTAAPITNHTTHAPITNHTTHAPITNHTTPAITNHTTPMTNHTTHAPITNHTTPMITNHTTATTPAPKPTPPAVLEVGDYSVKEGKVVCVRARLAIQLKIQYNVTGGKQSWGTFIVQPNKTAASGKCQDKQATLKLNFKEGSITFLFQKDNNNVFVKFIKAEVNYTFTNTESHFSASNNSLSVFGAGIGRSYSCKNQSVMINSGFYLETSQQQVQAFNITKGDFGPADFCPADKPNYTIAIAVGVVLAILIVIVIIAYLISRRRGQAGYQTL